MSTSDRFSHNRRLRKVLLPLAGAVAFLALWQIASTYFVSEQSTLPSPTQVASALREMWHSGELFEDVVASLNRIAVGFAIAFLGAMVFGVLAARYGKVYDSIRSVMDLLSSIPPIAWTPLAILWFGIGNAPAYFIVFLGAFFPMLTSIYAGITRVDKDLIDAAKTLGASPTFVVRNVIGPSSFPQIITGVRTGIGVAWFNVIAAELIGVRSGLGYKIQLSRTLLFSERVVAIMFVVGVLGFLMTRGVGIAGNLASPWAIQDGTRVKWIGRRRLLSRLFRRRVSSERGSEVPFALDEKAVTDTNETAPTASGSAALVSVSGISKSYIGQVLGQELRVLDGVSFDVQRREVFCIIGPNGSGKTTIVKILAGLLTPDMGTVHFADQAVSAPSSERTVVFQDLALFPWKSCRGNIELALRAQECEIGRPMYSKAAIHQKSWKSLREAALESFVDSYPADLSGGMKQRLALARALALSPKLILMDEPFASLDPIVRERSQETILKMLSNRGTTLLLVTHDLDEAVFMADRILVLSRRPGRVKTIVDVGLPRPRTAVMRQQREFHALRTKLWDLLYAESEEEDPRQTRIGVK